MTGPAIARTCRACGSRNIIVDAVAKWARTAQVFVRADTHDHATCLECGEEGPDAMVTRNLETGEEI